MLICSSCGNENPEGATFCNACAAPLAEQPSPAAEERKIVSVLFCDLVGFTGAPEAHEDDAERAVRAGLAILDAIVELNEADPGLDLQVRVGINTGEAVVALGARPERGEGIVTGDVVNTAARIQSAAPVNGLAVSDQTYRATSRVFEYEPLQ